MVAGGYWRGGFTRSGAGDHAGVADRVCLRARLIGGPCLLDVEHRIECAEIEVSPSVRVEEVCPLTGNELDPTRGPARRKRRAARQADGDGSRGPAGLPPPQK